MARNPWGTIAWLRPKRLPWYRRTFRWLSRHAATIYLVVIAILIFMLVVGPEILDWLYGWPDR